MTTEELRTKTIAECIARLKQEMMWATENGNNSRRLEMSYAIESLIFLYKNPLITKGEFINEDEPNSLTKEKIIAFAKSKRDTAPASERQFFAAIYFVLRNRTEENWGPKELTMADAMKCDFP